MKEIKGRILFREYLRLSMIHPFFFFLFYAVMMLPLYYIYNLRFGLNSVTEFLVLLSLVLVSLLATSIVTSRTEGIRSRILNSMETEIVKDSEGNVYFNIIIYENVHFGKKHERKIPAKEVENIDSRFYGEEIEIDGFKITILKGINDTQRIKKEVLVNRI